LAGRREVLVPLDWLGVSELSFNSLLLLERVQLSWFPGWVSEAELAVALAANPVVEWYARHKCPEIAGWLDGVMPQATAVDADAQAVRRAEEAVLREINDLLVYVVDPAVYDAQPFLAWDSAELVDLLDFRGKTVIDVGSGTGRLALTVAPLSAAVFAVEPVTNLRRYLKAKARSLGLRNVYAVDGLVTDVPFPDGFADVAMGGHVFGDVPEEEIREVLRVTKPGGTVIACPGTSDEDNETHRVFLAHGFRWSRFEEPQDGTKRKYWREKT
jgi:SAM-dependent methyltransferase